MAAERFGGRYSPDSGADAGRAGAPAAAGAPPAARFRNRRARRVSVRARLMYLLALPLLFAGLGATLRGSAAEMLGELGGFVALTLAAWLLNEGLRAEAAFQARKIARAPAIPRKLFAAVLTGGGVLAASLEAGPGLGGGIAFGTVAGLAQLAAFGLDPMRAKGIEGVGEAATDRVARAIDAAERLVAEIVEAARRIGDRPLEGRIERLCDQARDVFRVVEADPRDLGRARRFLSVYLLGMRDATVKFADLWQRRRDPEARGRFEDLLGDLEASFEAHRRELLEDDRGDLEIEIEVLRERLQQDGLIAR